MNLSAVRGNAYDGPMTRDGNERDGENRGGGPRAIAATVDRITRASLGRRGFAEASIVADWPAIVGETLAEHACPLRIAFQRGERGGGTLHLRVASGAMATEIQHLAPLLIERINGHYGYAAVARLAVTQGPLPQRRRRNPPPEPDLAPAQRRQLDERLAAIDDPQLRDALAALGRHILARKE